MSDTSDAEREARVSFYLNQIASKTLPDFIVAHLRHYAEDPVKAHLWDASAYGGSTQQPILLIVTKGSKSGNTSILPLVYAMDGDEYIIVGSAGGSPKHPAWYLNMVAADMRAEIQVADKHYRVKGRLLNGDERAQKWRKLAAAYPPLDGYVQKTDREIPLVMLSVMI